jgi:hypothetical protein
MIGPFANAFLIDRATVWEKLAEILLTRDLFTVIKTAKTSQMVEWHTSCCMRITLVLTMPTAWLARQQNSLPSALITVKSATRLLRSMHSCISNHTRSSRVSSLMDTQVLTQGQRFITSTLESKPPPLMRLRANSSWIKPPAWILPLCHPLQRLCEAKCEHGKCADGDCNL